MGGEPLSPAPGPGSHPRAVIAMSGGVDSSVAAWRMKEAGYDCIGITLKLFRGEGRCCSLADVNDARDAAGRLGIPHYVLNFTDAFDEEVIRRFIETYEGGGTPNPCIDCNRYIKFDLLLCRAQQLEAGIMATGHYARIERAGTGANAGAGTGNRWLLKKAADLKKDQSYVLYAMTQEQLSRTILPLGDLTKPEVREIAASQGFINARKEESQDICFVPDGDYGRFMEEYTGKRYPGGDILDEAGRVIGQHRGLVRYTLGQRRGLGVAAGEPLYVTAKDREANTLTLGRGASLYARSLIAGDLNLIACDTLDRPIRVKVKTRYLQAEQWALVTPFDEGKVRVDFDEPQRALTPGQAAVFYDGDLVVGGGTILCAKGLGIGE